MIRWAIASSALTLVLLFQLPAGAQSSSEERTLAEALFREARTLMDASRYAEACPKLAESQRLDPGGGTLLNLAVCHEKLGRTATAWGEYREALAQARREGRDDRIRFAQARIAAVEPALARLAVVVPDNARASGVKIMLDDVLVGEPAWGIPFPVDPGPRKLTVSAAGHRTWSHVVNVDARTLHRVKIPPLESTPASAPDAERRRDTETAGSSKTAAYVVGGLGLVAIAAGSYLGLRAASERSQSDDECPANRCSQRGVDLNDDAQRDANLANVGFGLGLVGVGVGAYLFFSADDGSPAVGARPTAGGGTLILRGTL